MQTYIDHPVFVSAVFFDEIADLLTNILATTSNSLLLTYDFNCPGDDSNTIEARLSAVLDLFSMVQTVYNLLDILAHKTKTFL